MSPPCWNKSEDYVFTETLSLAQWMWEFLRRNPAYREDWEWFNATWQKLESRYGKPPNRDFARWEADPLAYRQVHDDDCGECRVDQDRVLIECWMGAKWGFYKFPLSPDTDRPLIGEQLSWREIEWPAVAVDAACADYLNAVDGKVALGFDTELPLRPQLETAKRFLQARQARLRRSGAITLRTLESQRERWKTMLSLLDAQTAGVDVATIQARLAPCLENLEDFDAFRDEALALVAGGYRELQRIPETGSVHRTAQPASGGTAD